MSTEAISKPESEKGEFIWNIFIVKKKSGQIRRVNNLELLYEFVRYHHFKIETLEMVWATVKKNSYFVNIYSFLRKLTLQM